jgi:YVTN family beta-propeller protein
MNGRSTRILAGIVLLFVALAAGQSRGREPSPADDYDHLRVGPAGAERIVVPTNQVLSPQGRQVVLDGRPTDLALSPDGRWLAALTGYCVYLIDPAAGKVVSRASHAGGSFAGIVFSADGKRLLASSFAGNIGSFAVDADGELAPQPPIVLPSRTTPVPGQLDAAGSTAKKLQKSVLPAGLALGRDGQTLWAVLNAENALAEIDLAAGRVRRTIRVGNAPYGVVLLGERAYVSNWAGRAPGPRDPTGPSGSAPPVRVDARNIASEGSLSVVDLAAGREIRQIPVGLHPCGLAATPDGHYVLVANANSDSVSVIDARAARVVETIGVRPDEKLLFGSAPNALTVSPDGATLYVSNGGNNALAVIQLAPAHSRLLGCLPVGWYPAGLALDAARGRLYVANVKGVGPRSGTSFRRRPIGKEGPPAYNTHDDQGTVSLVPLPRAEDLPAATEAVLTNNRLTQAVSALTPPRKDAPPRPVPQRHGEPSLFKHVLYIIKENRTYDQVLGDVARGEGDPRLCIYGRDVTPNHHKLAEEFVLLDNFYCSGSISADGHQWTDEAYVTDYVEKAFGGFPRSYPHDGNDALAYASSGFLWDSALARGRTLRIYGEFVQGSVRWKDRARRIGPTFSEVYQDYLAGAGEIAIRGRATIKTLEPYVCPAVIGFPLTVPDLYRADQFVRELREFERSGELPNLMFFTLVQDHTSGTRPGYPTPAASVADNDLALGRVVEAVSRSRFWPETCIFVVEDDPQDGFDHVDGHRTVALVASPYTRRHLHDSSNYNQTSMVRTIELILGLPPMNQFDASATAMTTCFTGQPDRSPYEAVKNRVPIGKVNPQLSEIGDARERHWAEVSLCLPLDEADEADEDTLNRILWFAARGNDATYPAWAVGGGRSVDPRAGPDKD